MAEKLAADSAAYLERNKLVRSWWDNAGAKVPFFMVMGNHDGEHGWAVTKGKPSTADASAMRKEWLLDSGTAPRETYKIFSDTVYACEWGDALIVVLDPYSAESSKPTDDGWTWTLGKKQYDWLAGVLAASKAKYRFVFMHNILGGTGKDGRGAADWAKYYEWGGYSLDGKNDFATKRPGWALPVAALLKKYEVDIVFHGHDHFYAAEKNDGIIYQLVPQPSLGNPQGLSREALAEYGYSTGTFLPSPGYLRVSVSAKGAAIQYVKSADGAVAAEYAILP